jgi:hypothetical protein
MRISGKLFHSELVIPSCFRVSWSNLGRCEFLVSVNCGGERNVRKKMLSCQMMYPDKIMLADCGVMRSELLF